MTNIKTFYGETILKEENVEALLTYKYSGQDDSILY